MGIQTLWCTHSCWCIPSIIIVFNLLPVATHLQESLKSLRFATKIWYICSLCDRWTVRQSGQRRSTSSQMTFLCYNGRSLGRFLNVFLSVYWIVTVSPNLLPCCQYIAYVCECKMQLWYSNKRAGWKEVKALIVILKNDGPGYVPSCSSKILMQAQSLCLYGRLASCNITPSRQLRSGPRFFSENGPVREFGLPKLLLGGIFRCRFHFRMWFNPLFLVSVSL